MEEKKETTWKQMEQSLATEIIQGSARVSKAKDLAIRCLTIALILVSIGMSLINYQNDRDWRELFASYDYVSQDGEGFNYFNNEVGGDVSNGSESTEAER